MSSSQIWPLLVFVDISQELVMSTCGHHAYVYFGALVADTNSWDRDRVA